MKINNLSINYGTNVIYKNFSIDIEDYKTTCILGASGCGKTTLFKAICNEIAYDGNIINDKKISYCFQSPTLIPTINCKKNCEYVMHFCKDKYKKNHMIEEYFEILQIKECLNALPNAISGGQANRVAIARALCSQGEVMLLDESFKGLDYAIKNKIFNMLIKNVNTKKTLLFATHDIDEALTCADNIIILNRQNNNGAEICLSLSIETPKILRNIAKNEFIELREKIIKALTK